MVYVFLEASRSSYVDADVEGEGEGAGWHYSLYYLLLWGDGRVRVEVWWIMMVWIDGCGGEVVDELKLQDGSSSYTTRLVSNL